MEQISMSNPISENTDPTCVHIPWNGDKDVECPSCGEITGLHINKYYWRTVKHGNIDRELNLNIEIAYVQCQRCEKFFGIQPKGILPYKRVTERAIEVINSSYSADDISIPQLKERLDRDFHLDLSTQTLKNVINTHVAESPGEEERKGIQFSGIICIDGLHGKTDGADDVTILGIDPITGITMQGQLRTSESTANIEAFLHDLKTVLPHDPFLIITDFVEWDNSIQKIFPKSLHQKCHFHLMKHLTKGVKKEVTKYAQKQFGREIEELQEISRQTLTQEKQEHPQKLELNPQSETGKIIVGIANQIIAIVQEEPAQRKAKIEQLISEIGELEENSQNSLQEHLTKKKALTKRHASSEHLSSRLL